jgi:hypothetical protein
MLVVDLSFYISCGMARALPSEWKYAWRKLVQVSGTSDASKTRLALIELGRGVAGTVRMLPW